ncbi:MAG TPA: hemerythrin domain-containing protein, partial [Candidatus Competibacteraceae bacterium]|nr:hemerythrin domain-containing protein [Candidatus Competibacteraceae bacterium]
GLVAIATAAGTTLDKPAVSGFTALYRSHIETENSRLLPLAKALLTPAQLVSIGETMAARRRL